MSLNMLLPRSKRLADAERALLDVVAQLKLSPIEFQILMERLLQTSYGQTPDDLAAAAGGEMAPSVTVPPPAHVTPPAASANAEEGDGPAWWRKIEAWCLAHPTPDNIYQTRDVGMALYPDKPVNAAATAVFTTVKRRSTDNPSCRDPRFAMLGAGKFKVLKIGR